MWREGSHKVNFCYILLDPRVLARMNFWTANANGVSGLMQRIITLICRVSTIVDVRRGDLLRGQGHQVATAPAPARRDTHCERRARECLMQMK